MNRVAAPIRPIRSRRADERGEIHWRNHPMRERAGDCGRRHEQKKPREPKPARDRRSECDQPHAIQQHIRPRPVHECIGQHRPRLGAATQHLQFPICRACWSAAGSVFTRLSRSISPFRPDGDGQPARNECVIPDDPVLDRHRGPMKGRIDADENGDEAEDHNGRIEHRFGAARDPARTLRFIPVSASSSPTPTPRLPKPGPRGAGCSAPGYPP